MRYSKIISIVCLIAGVGAAAGNAGAEPTQFQAEVDRTEISLDEAVSLKLSTVSESLAPGVENPNFSAPDFDVLNQYSSSYVESVYENGKFKVKNRQTLTIVLRPKKTGRLNISALSMQVGGKNLSAPPIVVQVAAGGQGTPPARNYGSGTTSGGLRGQGRHSDGRSFFVRAQINKNKIYKGEQLIVSYYLYKRARVYNLQVSQFPILSGFLREDLEIPIMSGQLTSDYVIVDGANYERQLIARYAAYPLKEGKLPLDTMSIKGDVITMPGFDEDPFQTMFRSMAPNAVTSRSDPLNVEVLPLPSDGRPKDFSGGVGEFELSATVSKNEVKANEAITLTLKIQGRGNVSAIETPAGDFPKGLELFESKGVAHTGQGGIGEKTFEYLLIPRFGGTYTIPGFQVSTFNPVKRAYETLHTAPIVIQAEGPAPLPETAASPLAKVQSSPVENTPSLQGLKTWTSQIPDGAILLWLKQLSFLIGLILAGLLIKRGVKAVRLRASERLRQKARDPQHELSRIRALRGSDPTQAWTQLEAWIGRQILQKTGVAYRSISRKELKRIHTEDLEASEHKIKPEQWQSLEEVWRDMDLERFAGAGQEALSFDRWSDLITRLQTTWLD